MQNVENNDVVEIDLMEIFGLLLHRLWLVTLCAVAAAAAGYVVSRFVLTEQFESTTRVYVLNRQNDDTLTYTDVQLGTQLTKDFREIIKSRYVLEQVIQVCGLQDTSGSLASRISVDTQTDTRIITITVTHEDPAMAQYIANELREAAAERIKGVMDIQAVNVVDEANLPTAPSAPSVAKWTAIGFLLGAFLCMAVVLVQFLLDDTIKTSDDIEKYLGLSTLGMIPMREAPEERGRGRPPRGAAGGSQGSPGEAGKGQGRTAGNREDGEAVPDVDVEDIHGNGTPYGGKNEEGSHAED